ncbi:MAG: tyrosine-type recombinase/integrase [Tannerella sp.]|nr:tyrosine-type recombinase/integrase [Tannerella sp.]
MKRSLGFRYISQEKMLSAIDKLAFQRDETSAGITKEFAEDIKMKRPNELDINNYSRVCLLIQFSSYLSDLGIPSYIPKLPPYPQRNFVPYIFSKQEMNALFKACDELRFKTTFLSSPLFSIPALMRFLYGTGLRINEALALKNDEINIDEGYVRVKDSKSEKERIIPISDSLSAVLKDYAEHRNLLPLIKKSEYFFIKLDGTPIKCTVSVRDWFIMCLEKAGINFVGKHQGPRIHDLRHTFACHSLAGMAESGMDLYTSLPILSTYLGHQSLASTNHYVRLASAIYPELIKEIDIVFLDVFPSANMQNQQDHE